MLDVRGRRAVVVGLGASGIAACRLLTARGARVIGTDTRTNVEVPGIDLALGGHDGAHLDKADLVVVSPGVPSFPELEALSCPIWSEIELGYRALEGEPTVIAIGGTNGKSTVTTLVGEMLLAAGKRTFVGGNLGEPLASHVDERWDAVVLEVSSFQMERIDAFAPDVAVLLNVTPDHLDRYPSFEAYAHAKGNMFVKQTGSQRAVVPAGDAICAAQVRRGRARIMTFGAGGDIEVRSDRVVAELETEAAWRTHEFPISEIKLQGRHNVMNVAASIAAVRSLGVDAKVIREVLRTFAGLPHRMVLVRERGGVRFYDDSKGTNVGASVTALRGVAEPKVVLVAGGRDKGGSYGPLVDALRDRGRAAVLIGEAADAIAKAIGDVVPVKRATSMDDAVRAAAELARSGDGVLLSPACSSFDMFKDYKDRGDAFVRAVMALP